MSLCGEYEDTKVEPIVEAVLGTDSCNAAFNSVILIESIVLRIGPGKLILLGILDCGIHLVCCPQASIHMVGEGLIWH
jgi:hypothetical protein